MSPWPAPEECALLFDIDGTLVDSTYHHALAWQRAFHDEDVSVPLFRIHRAVGMGGDKLVASVAGDEIEDRLGDRLRDRWRKRYEQVKGEVLPLPGAADLVHRVTRAGYRVALASSGEPELAAEAVALLGIGDDVSVVTTSKDVEDSKPDPDLVGETLARLDRVSHALFVGDTPYDVTAARRSGLGCIGVRSGGYSGAELADAGAVLVVDLPGDLLELDWVAHCSSVDQS